MSNTDIESNTHTATRLDDDDPVPGQDSPAHDTAGSGRATTFVAAGEALSVILGSALCICSALLCAVACVVRLSIGVRG